MQVVRGDGKIEEIDVEHYKRCFYTRKDECFIVMLPKGEVQTFLYLAGVGNGCLSMVDKVCEEQTDLTKRALDTRGKMYKESKERKCLRIDLAHLFGEYEWAIQQEEEWKAEKSKEREEYILWERISNEALRLDEIRKTKEALQSGLDVFLSAKSIVDVADDLQVKIPLRTRGRILSKLERYNPRTGSYRCREGGAGSKTFLEVVKKIEEIIISQIYFELKDEPVDELRDLGYEVNAQRGWDRHKQSPYKVSL